jgi:hypothetical protein
MKTGNREKPPRKSKWLARRGRFGFRAPRRFDRSLNAGRLDL